MALLDRLGGVGKFGLGAPLLLIAMLSMMVLPLPPVALDMLFTFNIALSLVVIMVAVYTPRPLEFAVFPTVLLVATLLRLALNIASTRVILLEGHTGTDAAGQVIQAFGDFVVGGNYAVGLVVFAILIIINFVVVTKGAGRVSEVSARFTLDSMPGKQMAIDADLNAGLLSQEEARRRREEIASEADFYGSMDGASKFVRGDAIAGILILFVNIIGGLTIGMVQHAMSLGDAATNYVLLTIGRTDPLLGAVVGHGYHRDAGYQHPGYGAAGPGPDVLRPEGAVCGRRRDRRAGYRARDAERRVPGSGRADRRRRVHDSAPGAGGGGRGRASSPGGGHHTLRGSRADLGRCSPR
jgi:hypothetical protein